MGKFQTGNLYQTRGIAAATEERPQLFNEIINAYARYIKGDWGDLCEEDKEVNEEALKYGDRLLGKYKTSVDDIYIITEADRSATTILFYYEY